MTKGESARRSRDSRWEIGADVQPRAAGLRSAVVGRATPANPEPLLPVVAWHNGGQMLCRLKSAAAAAFCAVALVPPAHAETAVLRNGQRLAVTGYEHEGANLLLHIAGGMVTVPADEVVRIEPEESFPPNPPPVVP